MALPELMAVHGNKAYSKYTTGYVSYASKSDAMLASLLTFHEVPYQMLDLISMTRINPQDFDSKQFTFQYLDIHAGAVRVFASISLPVLNVFGKKEAQPNLVYRRCLLTGSSSIPSPSTLRTMDNQRNHTTSGLRCV